MSSPGIDGDLPLDFPVSRPDTIRWTRQDSPGSPAGHTRPSARAWRRAANTGFTLIELLAVIAIIAILAAALLRTAGMAQRNAAEGRAKAEIASLSSALESYKADHGDYPHFTNATAGTNGDNSLLRSYLAPATGKVYLEFSRTMGTNATGPILDPFGENYGYQYPGDPNRNGKEFFDLFSRGASAETNRWIKNW